MRGHDELEKVEIRIFPTAGRITVETARLYRNPQVSAEYDIKVSSGVNVAAVESSNGKLVLSRLRGDLVAGTSNGSIGIRDIEGSVSARTSNGRIDITCPLVPRRRV